MRIVLIVRGDEAEVTQAHRAFHLSAGVAAVMPADESADETGPAADWLIEGEANEFWWPRQGSLHDVLESVPPRYGSIQAFVRQFVAAPTSSGSFAERMIYRLSPQLGIGELWRPSRRLVHRPNANGPLLRGWYPIEVFRFALGAESLFTANMLERAAAEGVVHIDTRLRDVLRTLAQGLSPVFPRPTVMEEAQFARDVATLGEADVLQTHARLDELEARLAAVESTLPEMLKRRLRKLAGRN